MARKKAPKKAASGGVGVEAGKKIWMNGKMVAWDRANVHVLSHVIHYGSSTFEGMRCYATNKGPAIFRLTEHIDRLFMSAKIYRMKIPYTHKQLIEACKRIIKVNDMDFGYIRPVVYRGYGSMGVNPMKCPVDVAVAAWKWGAYLGEDAADVCVSSWTRMAPNTLPSLAKAGANYMNSQLIKMEAIVNGYVEGIALDVNGYVCEGSGENIFIIKGGGLVTPPSGASILPGITRNSVIQLAHKLNIPVRKQLIPRAGLYIADECFLTGSAAEITPVRSIDRIKIGTGKAGPVTRKIRKEFMGILDGSREDTFNWLEYL